MWLSAIKLAVSAGSKIYANKQKTKMAMSEAQLMHATKMAQGQEAYQGKLLEARQSDWKDEAVLIILSTPVLILAWAVVSDDPTAMDKVKLFFEMFSAASIVVYKFMDTCGREYLWYKGNSNI
jgi:uncharacterized ion transporter superfamily protein YfcC